MPRPERCDEQRQRKQAREVGQLAGQGVMKQRLQHKVVYDEHSERRNKRRRCKRIEAIGTHEHGENAKPPFPDDSRTIVAKIPQRTDFAPQWCSKPLGGGMSSAIQRAVLGLARARRTTVSRSM